MRERAGLLAGDVQIETREGNGTTIILHLPR
jgi:nitrate/nitrite-specific signal transduction histidine kinase